MPLVQCCSNCGQPITAGRKFCASCGTGASSAGNQTPAANVLKAHPPIVTGAAVPRANPWKAISGLISLGVCLWVFYQTGMFGDLKSAVTTSTPHSMY
jgi:hypothetical protein